MNVPTMDVQPALEVLEARARELELEAQQCREAAATLRRTFNVSPLGPVVTTAGTPDAYPPAAVRPPAATVFQDAGGDGEDRVATRGPASPPATRARRRVPSGPKASAGPAVAAVADLVRVLAAATGPLRRRTLYDQLPAPRPGYHWWRAKVLRRAVAAGEVTMLGRQSSARYQLPGRPTPEAPAPATRGASVESPVPDRALLAAIDRILGSGASYDLNEVARHLRPICGDVDRARLAETMEALAKDRRVERIAVGSTTRYRKRAKVSVS